MLQFVDDPELLPAAAGSLGLLGIVTAITYKVSQNKNKHGPFDSRYYSRLMR